MGGANIPIVVLKVTSRRGVSGEAYDDSAVVRTCLPWQEARYQDLLRGTSGCSPWGGSFPEALKRRTSHIRISIV